MIKKYNALFVLLSSLIFCLIFYKQSPGLNVLVFELFCLGVLFISGQFRLKGKNLLTCLSGLIITSICTVVVYTPLSYIVNFMLFGLFIGMVIHPQLKSILNAFKLSASNFVFANLAFLKRLTQVKLFGMSPGNYLLKYRIFIIPMLVVFVFISIYRNANPIFNSLFLNVEIYLQKYLAFFEKYLSFLEKHISMELLFVFIFGFIISLYIFMRVTNTRILAQDEGSKENLLRKREKNMFPFFYTGLKNEVKAGFFLLVVLNLILFVLNVIDIYSVWFNFQWNGSYLKDFVREGTYLLIVSILISIGIVLWLFRGNINFYSRNKALIILAYAWIAQNAILAVSVGIRNYWYIHYFSLAYKRIGIFIFLMLTLYGLYTVFVKVMKKKSAFYLYRSNSYFFIVVMVMSSLFNWDVLIAKYNFNNYEHSFLHLNFLVNLSDKALPYLDKTEKELAQISIVQEKQFSFASAYMNPSKYYAKIQDRKIHFKENWESKGFWSWNLAESRAYDKLKQKELLKSD